MLGVVGNSSLFPVPVSVNQAGLRTVEGMEIFLSALGDPQFCYLFPLLPDLFLFSVVYRGGVLISVAYFVS